MPYDQIVHGVLCASSREGKAPEEWIAQVKAIDAAIEKGFDSELDYAKRDTLDLYWRRQQVVPIEQWGERTAAAFMGIRVECAQCHKHPFDRWTQAEYRAYANVFAAMTSTNVSAAAKKAADKENLERRGGDTTKKVNANQINLITREVYLGYTLKPFVHPDTNERRMLLLELIVVALFMFEVAAAFLLKR